MAAGFADMFGFGSATDTAMSRMPGVARKPPMPAPAAATAKPPTLSADDARGVFDRMSGPSHIESGLRAAKPYVDAATDQTVGRAWRGARGVGLQTAPLLTPAYQAYSGLTGGGWSGPHVDAFEKSMDQSALAGAHDVMSLGAPNNPRGFDAHIAGEAAGMRSQGAGGMAAATETANAVGNTAGQAAIGMGAAKMLPAGGRPAGPTFGANPPLGAGVPPPNATAGGMGAKGMVGLSVASAAATPIVGSILRPAGPAMARLTNRVGNVFGGGEDPDAFAFRQSQDLLKDPATAAQFANLERTNPAEASKQLEWYRDQQANYAAKVRGNGMTPDQWKSEVSAAPLTQDRLFAASQSPDMAGRQNRANYDQAVAEYSNPTFQREYEASPPEVQKQMMAGVFNRALPQLATLNKKTQAAISESIMKGDNTVTPQEFESLVNTPAGGELKTRLERQGSTNVLGDMWNTFSNMDRGSQIAIGLGVPLGLFGLLSTMGGKGGIGGLLLMLLGGGMAAGGAGLFDTGEEEAPAAAAPGQAPAAADPMAQYTKAMGGDKATQDELIRAEGQYPWLARMWHGDAGIKEQIRAGAKKKWLEAGQQIDAAGR